MEAIKETYARNKAEELVKVLMEIICVQKEWIEVKENELSKDKVQEMDDDMEVDEASEAWGNQETEKENIVIPTKKVKPLTNLIVKNVESIFLIEEN